MVNLEALKLFTYEIIGNLKIDKCFTVNFIQAKTAKL